MTDALVSADWRATNKTLNILTAARNGGYGVLALVVYNITHILGSIAAAEKLRSPLILQLFPTIPGWQLLAHAISHAAAHATVPIALHLDHAQSPDHVRIAAETLPFDSIMVDMSHHSRSENLELTAELTKVCHAKHIAVEAEPGMIEGDEDGIGDTAGLEAVMTTSEDVKDFGETGIDILAPAWGNVHGDYGPKGPKGCLDWKRLGDVVEAVNANATEGGRGRGRRRSKMELAVHGTGGWSEEEMKRCVKMGVTKVNVNRSILDPWQKYLEVSVGKIGLVRMLEKGQEVVQEGTERELGWCGSVGKAS